MDKLNTQILRIVRHELATGELRLPSLPDVVMDVWELLRNPKTSGDELARAMRRDPVMSARLIAIANSAFYRRARAVTDVHQAVVVLGDTIVRHTVAMLGVARLYQVGTSPAVKPLLHHEWMHGTLVASISELLAREWGHLTVDGAMLAGLIHRIGVLPLLTLAERQPRMVADAAIREHIIGGLHVQVGVELLKGWDFPEEMITVVREHEDLARVNHGMVDYVDIVQAAILVSYQGTAHPWAQMDWGAVGAVSALGISTADVDDLLEYCGPHVGELRSLLTKP
ncbi:MAG: HDOD domain-containing protein [Gammaproteobacteria bacterium]|nr:HDOD domain-containing protein [Gammaproteobacteria bacterium]